MSTHYTCGQHIELIELDQEWVIMDTERFTITKINLIGASILKALMDNKTMDEIVEMIEKNYDVESNQVQVETLAFLQELQKVGIIYECSI